MSVHGKLETKRQGHFRGPEEVKTLDAYLSGAIAELSTKESGWLIEFGAVYVNHKRETLKNRLIDAQDIIRVHFEPKRYSVDKNELRARVVHETDNFLIVDKPSGLPMHPTLDNLTENLISGFSQQLFVTHRLDVPTSGLVVIAKTKEYQKLFNQLLTDRKITKRYTAFTERPVEPQEYTHFMIDDVKAPKKVFSSHPKEKYFACRLIILSCKEIETQIYKIEVELLTGRTHQIRAQLSALGAPIIGDEMYGGRPSQPFGLASTMIAFVCPKTHQPIKFSLAAFDPVIFSNSL